MKRVQEIFRNFEAGVSLNTAIVKAVVLKEKSKTLEMKISSDNYIEVSDLESLNQFIREQLTLEDSEIIVEYSEGTPKKPIEEELKKIINLLARKHPLLKSALNNCDFDITDQSIQLTFKIAVSYLLKGKGYDKIIQEAIKNLYGAHYTVHFADKVNPEDLVRLQEATQEKELQLIQKERLAVPAAPPPPGPAPQPGGPRTVKALRLITTTASPVNLRFTAGRGS